MMVGEGVEEEPNPCDEWPPPDSSVEVTNKDGTSSRLVFLTVQYVGNEAQENYNSGLRNFTELNQQVVTTEDNNISCIDCYTPNFGTADQLIQQSETPSGEYLIDPTPPTASEHQEVSGYMTSQTGHVYSDDSKLLLLPTDSGEMMVDANGDQRVEFLMSNGTIAYGIVKATDNNGTQIIQIPSEYLIAARPEHTEITAGEINGQNLTRQEESVEQENVQLPDIYYSLDDQGMIIESGNLQVEREETDVSTSILKESSLVPLCTNLPQEAQQKFWCEDCNMLLDQACKEHQISCKISDKLVPSRAYATLPAAYLSINLITDSGTAEYGVFARKTIPKRTQFGPIEGVLFKTDEDVEVIEEKPSLKLTIETEDGKMKQLDVSNEHMSNWMRFVRFATPERPPNLLVSQVGSSLFFTSTLRIQVNKELLVWYSPAYAIRRNLPIDPPSPVWTCSTCGDKFKSHEELMQHSTLHIQKSKREEQLTVNSLRRKHQALVASVSKYINERHIPDMRINTQFECAICRKIFRRRYNLKRHILMLHTCENRFHCKICHQGFSHSYSRRRHMRKVHAINHEPLNKTTVKRYESWSCSHCKLTFNSSTILSLHTMVHATNNTEENPENKLKDLNKSFFCPQCDKKFTDKRTLTIHVAEHGRIKNPREKKFHCDICGRNFISAIRFKAHKMSHIEDATKAVQCEICKKKLRTESALSCHLKIHDCTMQWQCPMCKNYFTNVLALRVHIHTHAVNGFFHCPHCGKKFQEYKWIRKHVRTFHSETTFKCDICGKAFHSRDKLRLHNLSHSDKREFLCAHCGKQFKRKDKLSDHMKKMHSTDVNKSMTQDKRGCRLKKRLTKEVNVTSDYQRYIYKCHECMLGFKRRGMLVNHLANRHPEITPESVPELNLPILKTTRDYYCQYCQKVYKSSSKRKAHILKIHPGLQLPLSDRHKGVTQQIPGIPNLTFSQTVGSVTTTPHGCQWCHKQYASKAKLLQHQRKKHFELIPHTEQIPRVLKVLDSDEKNDQDNEDLTTYDDLVKDDDPHPLELSDNNIMLSAENPVPIALSTNITNHMLSSQLVQLPGDHEYEIITTEYDVAGNDILVDPSSAVKKSGYKNDNISSDLLSQAMSEIGVSLSDFKALSSEQYLKLLQSPNGHDSLYLPYPAR